MQHIDTTVTELPACDICGATAAYDAKTKFGPWAYMCELDYKLHGVGLGLGLGQRLVPQ